jgi:hypothetical protein
VRRLITRSLAILPAVLVIGLRGASSVTDLLTLSQATPRRRTAPSSSTSSDWPGSPAAAFRAYELAGAPPPRELLNKRGRSLSTFGSMRSLCG